MSPPRTSLRAALLVLVLGWWATAQAEILWSDLGETLVHESGPGADILGGALKRDDSSSDTLYFKLRVNPLSDGRTEPYLAAFQLFEGDNGRLALGNSLEAWAYSAFGTAQKGESNNVDGDFDLHSATPDSPGLHSYFSYELPRRGIECTIVFKVQYVPGTNDLVTVWLNPNLSPGATEAEQTPDLTTRFRANASFNELRLRHVGGGGGWRFSDLAIATAFDDFVSPRKANGLVAGASSLTFQPWQREQGLPQNSVRALARTHDGYLWIGDDDGLARFDGVRFVSFDIREGFRSGPVGALFEDARGALWIGTVGGGLTRLSNGRFATFAMADGLPAESITALAEDRAWRMWVGTEAGLAIYDHDHLQPLEAAADFKGKTIAALCLDRQGIMWVGVTGGGVFAYRKGRFEPLIDETAEPPNPDAAISIGRLLRDPHCLLADRAGRIWIGAGDDNVLCLDAGQWHRHRIPRHLTARPYVSSLVEEPDGTICAGSASEGLFEFKGGKLPERINVANGLLDDSVESLLADREGNLWVGTGAGLNRLRRSNLSVLGQNEGLGYGAVQGLAEVSPGVIWAGKPSDGLYRSEGNAFSRLAGAESAQRYLQISSLLKASDGSCWVGGAHGLLHFKNPAMPANDMELALAGLNVISLAEAGDGGIWVGAREGDLRRLAGNEWVSVTNLAQTHAITAMVPNSPAGMWIGTEGGGVYRVGDGAPFHLDTRAGLLSDLVRALYRDSKGTLWIGTAGGGLSRWRNGRVANFTSREGLPDNTVSQILEDNEGNLWLGSNRGIARISKAELDQLADRKITAIFPRIYGHAEGMVSEECTGGFCPAGLKTFSGLLWFSTAKGIAVVDPRPQQAKAPPPGVVLEEVLLDGVRDPLFTPTDSSASDGKALPAGEADDRATLRIPPGRHRIEFRYTGLSFSAPERIRFRYQLQNFDPDWLEASQAGTSRTAPYSYVPPGAYRFRVIACNSEGVWNEVGATLPLIVVPYFWQTWWFLGLAAVALLGVVVGAARLVEKNKLQHQLKRLEQERSLERERARIAQDLHDDLGSSLARLSLLSGLVKADKNNPGQVEAHANRMAQSSDQTMRALEEIVWAVRPDSDSLQSLVEYIAHFANEQFDGNNARCRLDLPPDLPDLPLPPDLRHNIFLIVKEALTNALKHASAREVRVTAKANSGLLQIVVQDDGKSFDSKTALQERKRNGLGNMRDRAAAVGGILEITSEPGSGTRVSLSVDLLKVLSGGHDQT